MGRKSRHEHATLAHLRDRYVGSDRVRRELLDHGRICAQIARQIYALRAAAGLTQQELARLVGTTQSVISRLEDADYEGHSVSMLRRIATALHARLEVRFTPSA